MYCEWTSVASVDGLFWKRICSVLVLLHGTCWAVCVCVYIYICIYIYILFFKVSLPPCYSTFPSPYHHGWVYLALQNYILNSLLGYSSCRYPKLDIYSTKLIISLFPNLHLFLFFLFRVGMWSHPWIIPLPPTSSQSLLLSVLSPGPSVFCPHLSILAAMIIL